MIKKMTEEMTDIKVKEMDGTLFKKSTEMTYSILHIQRDIHRYTQYI